MQSLTIRAYADTDAAAFYAINAAWIAAMFVLEPHDDHVLSHPRTAILDPGGVILVAETVEHGVIATCALMQTASGVFELTKMGVRADVRGAKAGETLLRAMLVRVATMPIDSLYLLTSSKCAAAIHLYEKAGFVHDPTILAAHGGTYARCDVAMAYPIAAIARA